MFLRWSTRAKKAAKMSDPRMEKAERERQYRAAMAAYGAENASHHDPQAVVACGLCDDEGYRGSAVCDHIDHQGAAKRGMDMIRQAMGWQR